MPKYLLIILTSLLIALDFFSKQYFEGILRDGHVIEIFHDFVTLRLSYNSGVAFSLPIHGIPLQIITVAIIGFLLYYFFREEYPKKSKLLDIAYVLIFAGALSHAHERIVYGHVIDFIAVKYFAILNFADIFISIGAFLIFCFYVFLRKRG